MKFNPRIVKVTKANQIIMVMSQKSHRGGSIALLA